MRFILCEGRLEDLKTKNPLLVDYIDTLASSDPSGNLKYLDWEVKQLKNGFSVNDIAFVVERFHDNVRTMQRKDINAYVNVDELMSALSDVRKSKRAEKGEAKFQGAQKIYDDPERFVIFIKSKDAAMLYGKGTQWCVTSRNTGHYERYTMANVLFYYIMSKVLNNDDPMYKAAAAVQRDLNNTILSIEIFNAEDEVVPNDKFPAQCIEKIMVHAERQPSSPLVTLGKYTTEDEALEAIKPYIVLHDEANIQIVKVILDKVGFDERYDWVRMFDLIVAKGAPSVQMSLLIDHLDLFDDDEAVTLLKRLKNDKNISVYDMEAIAREINDPDRYPKTFDELSKVPEVLATWARSHPELVSTELLGKMLKSFHGQLRAIAWEVMPWDMFKEKISESPTLSDSLKINYIIPRCSYEMYEAGREFRKEHDKHAEEAKRIMLDMSRTANKSVAFCIVANVEYDNYDLFENSPSRDMVLALVKQYVAEDDKAGLNRIVVLHPDDHVIQKACKEG